MFSPQLLLVSLLKCCHHHHHRHFWQAPLRVHSAECRHQSPEWTVLSQVNCIVHIEVAGFQILLYGFQNFSSMYVHECCAYP